MQKISLQFDAMEASIASLKVDFNYIRHMVTDKINELGLFRLELFKKLDDTMEVCTQMETRLDKMQRLDNLIMESNVKQALASSVRSLVISDAAPHYGTNKCTFAKTEPTFHSAPTRGVVSNRDVDLLLTVLPLTLALLDHPPL